MINRDRLTEEFCRLVSIDSPTFNERKMADYLTEKLNRLGIEVTEDNAGEHYNGTAGNLYGKLKGDIDGEPILLCAHIDTVEPGIGKKAVVHSDGKITSDGTTVLGADDLAGVVAIIEVIRAIKENNLKHRDIEVLFPIAEEAYIKGTNVFDFSKIKSKSAYVFDLSGENGTVALQAPTFISFTAEVKGKAAHAGFSPEKGINAIAVTAEAIADIKQGHIDAESTLNIGTIEGGKAKNIVSDRCIIRGEIRSYNHGKAVELKDSLKSKFEAVCKKYGAELSFDYSVDVSSYKIDKNSETVKKYEAVCNELGIPVNYISTFGGSDNNNFVKNGIDGIVVSCGYNNAHTTEEYITVAELEKTAAIILNLITR
jgi:tripeptide aminopeptidase